MEVFTCWPSWWIAVFSASVSLNVVWDRTWSSTPFSLLTAVVESLW